MDSPCGHDTTGGDWLNSSYMYETDEDEEPLPPTTIYVKPDRKAKLKKEKSLMKLLETDAKKKRKEMQKLESSSRKGFSLRKKSSNNDSLKKPEATTNNNEARRNIKMRKNQKTKPATASKDDNVKLRAFGSKDDDDRNSLLAEDEIPPPWKNGEAWKHPSMVNKRPLARAETADALAGTDDEGSKSTRRSRFRRTMSSESMGDRRSLSRSLTRSRSRSLFDKKESKSGPQPSKTRSLSRGKSVGCVTDDEASLKSSARQPGRLRRSMSLKAPSFARQRSLSLGRSKHDTDAESKGSFRSAKLRRSISLKSPAEFGARRRKSQLSNATGDDKSFVSSYHGDEQSQSTRGSARIRNPFKRRGSAAGTANTDDGASFKTASTRGSRFRSLLSKVPSFRRKSKKKEEDFTARPVVIVTTPRSPQRKQRPAPVTPDDDSPNAFCFFLDIVTAPCGFGGSSPNCHTEKKSMAM